MRLFKCSTNLTLTIVDLPRPAWRVVPPTRLQVVLTVAGIVVIALAWALTR